MSDVLQRDGQIGSTAKGVFMKYECPRDLFAKPSIEMANNYLNKKSWHPGSKRNLERVWKAEEEEKKQRVAVEERDKQLREEAAWEAEQELTADEAAKRKGGVAWMYQNGMPMTSAVAKGATAHAVDVDKRRKQTQSRDDPARAEARLAKMLDGIRSTGVPSAGGESGGAYGFVGGEFQDEDDEDLAFRIAQLPEDERGKELKRIKKRERKEAKRAKEERRAREVQAARALLREAGIDFNDHM